MTGASPPRNADFVLTAAIALVALLVLALLLVLGAGAQLYAETSAQRTTYRDTRNALIAFTQAQTDAVVAQRSYLLNQAPESLDAYNIAKAETLARLAEVRRLSATDPAADQRAARLESLLGDELQSLDLGIRTGRFSIAREAERESILDAIETETDALHNSVVLRSNRSRQEEDATRRRIDTLAGALAFLSLITSTLAVLALRRERQQWRLATEAAEEARQRAIASDLAKTRFLAVASHDMRQPLHALTLYISALQRRVETEEARDILSKMERATASMVGMFATLLDLARIQAGVVNAEITTFPLQDVLDRIIAENPGVSVAATRSTVSLHSDPALVERILRNLVSNALRHGGGAARIDVTPADDGQVTIAVIDSGPGIPEADRARIFEEFVQLDGRAGSEGLGLGLAIVKRIADLLGATIEVSSPPGGGARFAFTARVAEIASAYTPREATSTAALGGAKVLVVDDDPLARSAMAGALRDLGADVRDGGNESDGKAILAGGFAPRLLVMDLRIDGELQGIDIAKRLSASLQHPARVIVVTGDTAPDTLSLLRASGFAWLIKPVDPVKLGEAASDEIAALSSSTSA